MTTPEAIVPDDKDWTWVLDRPCAECGADMTAVAPEAVAAMIRENAAAWPAVLARPTASVRTDPQRWSVLEYGCHVRDVFRLYAYRLGLMLDEDDPLYPNWDQDATAVGERYDRQDPNRVADELVAAGEELAAAFDGVRSAMWARPGRRSDGATFTVETFARYLIHDPIHHLWDVGGSGAGGDPAAPEVGGD